MDLGECSGSKRKHSGSESNSSDGDEGEFELYSKYYTIKRDKSKNPSKTANLDESHAFHSPRRKRRYQNKQDCIPVKRGKYYFLTDKMTKPKKHNSKVTPTMKSTTPRSANNACYVRVAPRGHLCLAQRSSRNADMFCSKETMFSNDSFKKVDLSFHVGDEIALEGLDGITLEAFWKRLRCSFPNYISKTVANRIWKLICKNKRINFYILKEPRNELVPLDRNKYMDHDSGSFIEPFLDYKEIYPFQSIQGINDVRGSCATFNTRKEFNNLRKFSLDKATKQFEQRLVMVADQELRDKTLMSEECDPNIELMDVEYCLLERVGRSRWQGEMTSGESSLSSAQNSLTSSYHHKKNLQQYGLLTNQTFHVKSLTKQQIISGGLLHLTRFYKKRQSKQVVVMEQVAQVLRSRSNYQLEYAEFHRIFGNGDVIRKLPKAPDFKRFFKIFTVPYRRLYPNASPSEYMRKSNVGEKIIRVIRLINPSDNIAAILMGDKEKKQNETKDQQRTIPGHKLFNRDLLRDLYLYIRSIGSEGVTLHEILDYSSMDYYTLRAAIRKLLLRHVIASHKIDLGRQQSLKFYALGDHFDVVQPQIYELTPETSNRLESLLGYKNHIPKVDHSSTEMDEETTAPLITKPLCMDLMWEPFVCTNFLTETVDSISEESTIFGIILKGRDRLLLLQSNLFDNYISEWDDKVIENPSNFEEINLFQNGFGKIIYDYLCEIKPFDTIPVDNKIVFDAKSIASTKVQLKLTHIEPIQIFAASKYAYSEVKTRDFHASVYLFQAMFDPDHSSDKMSKLDEGLGDTHEMTAAIKPEIQVEIMENLQTEPFMGSNPYLVEHSLGPDDLETLIYISTPARKRPQNPAEFTGSHVEYSRRYLQRANMILENVHERKITKGLVEIYQFVKGNERVEGYDKTVCKKSIRSIVAKLIEEGYMKAIQYVIRGGSTVRTQIFICPLEVAVDDPIIKSTVDEIKMKFFMGAGQTLQKNVVKVRTHTESPFTVSDVKTSIDELKQLTSRKVAIAYKMDKNVGKTYGFCPKFSRLRVLHEFLFYLTRTFIKDDPLDKAQTFELCTKHKIKTNKEEVDAMHPVFCNEISWKMFINPLPQHSFPKGWSIASDIILRMPISVFVKLHQIHYVIPELQAYLQNPIKRHYLIKHLPVDIRNVLLLRKKYFFAIYETFTLLCYIGLAQFGARNFKDKDQVFLYVNSKASLYDTTTSKPGYHKIEEKKYKKIKFDFVRLEDVEAYWTELLRVCMNTHLGKRKGLDGITVTIEEAQSKAAMIETTNPKDFKQAVEEDTGYMPGDRLGAACTDSALWIFMKKNWVWASQDSENKASQWQVPGLKTEKYESALPQPILSALTEKKTRLVRHAKLRKVKKMPTPVKIKTKRKVNKRKIRCAYRVRMREYYDEIDKKIMAKNQHTRVDWDETEDQLLRLSRVAYVFLCPHYNKQYIPYNIIRDVLHRLSARSRNKTSKAIQRRIYLLLSDEVLKIMESNVENLLNSAAISRYFAQVRNRFRTNAKLPDQKLFLCYVYLMSYLTRHKKETELLLLGYVATMDYFSPPYITLFENVLQNANEFAVKVYETPKTVLDVRKDVIKTIVHCSLACQKYSVGWAYQLFHIYAKLPDDLIRQCVAEMRKCQFLVFHRSISDKNVTETWHSPLKFSQAYRAMLPSTHSTKNYQESYGNFVEILENSHGTGDFIAYNELCTFYTRVKFVFDVPEMGLILNPDMHDHSGVIDELARRFHCFLTKIAEQSTKLHEHTATNPIKVMDVPEIKSEVMHLIFRVPYLFEGNLEMYYKKMSESRDDSEVRNYIWLMIVELKKFASETTKMGSNLCAFLALMHEDSDVEKLLQNMAKVVFVIQYVQQGKTDQECQNFEQKFQRWEVEELGKTRPKQQQSMENEENMKMRHRKRTGMENCVKKAENGVFPTLEEIKKGMMENDAWGKERDIPHITDLITLLNEGRFPEFDTDRTMIEKMKQHFVVQYPKLQELRVPLDDLEELRSMEPVVALMDREKVAGIREAAKCYNIAREPEITEKMYKEVPFFNDLIHFIKEKRELGATCEQLTDRYTDTQLLLEALEILTTHRLIFRTGNIQFLFVHHEYQNTWVTETFSFTDSEKAIFSAQTKPLLKRIKSLIDTRLQETGPLKVQLKPWTMLDGALNEQVFNDWLCMVLSKCLNYPNVMFTQLCEQFTYVKPVDLFYLLEVLENLSCIQLCAFSAEENVLFASMQTIVEEKATQLHNFNDIYVRVLNVSGLSFGSYLFDYMDFTV